MQRYTTCAGWKRSQWLFLADEAVAAPDAWLLAVQLEGPAEAVDWVDPLADAGAIIFVRRAPTLPLAAQCPADDDWHVHTHVGRRPLHMAERPVDHECRSPLARDALNRHAMIWKIVVLLPSPCPAAPGVLTTHAALNAGANNNGHPRPCRHRRASAPYLPEHLPAQSRPACAAACRLHADAYGSERACRDLRRSAPDQPNRLWRATGDDTCAVTVRAAAAAAAGGKPGGAGNARGVRNPSKGAHGCQGPGGDTADLAAWAAGSTGLLTQLRERAATLLC